MASLDRSLTKRRRLEEASLNGFGQGESSNDSEHYYSESGATAQATSEVIMSSGNTYTAPSFYNDHNLEFVCFGMLAFPPTQNESHSWKAQLFTSGSLLNVDRAGTLYTFTSKTPCGALGSRDTMLLHFLCREGIEFELRWISAIPSAGNASEETVWATIYGPRSLASSLRDTLQSLQFFLQDPLYAMKNVPYFNLQRFYNYPNTRTIDFQRQEAPPAPSPDFQDEQVVAENVLDRLNIETHLHETAGSPHLNTALKSHQKQALTFMINRETGWGLRSQGKDVWSQAINSLGYPVYINNVESCTQDQCPPNFRGGILADPMGLGKTLSIISLIAHDKDGIRGSEPTKQRGEMTGRGTLVVLPPSLIHHWEEELAKHLSGDAFVWLRYHGQHRNHIDSFDICDIVLTTYNTLAKEWKDQDKGQNSMLLTHAWHRVVLDEAHEIKTLSTAKSQSACALVADCRWAVTGTPIQNRLSELFSLIYFLRLSPYSVKKAFDRAFTKPWLRGEGSGFKSLKKLLGHIMLRRPKTSIELPKREDHRRCLTFSKLEQETYDIAKTTAVKCLDDVLDSGNLRKGYRNALQKINALRVICELGCQPRQNTFVSPKTNLLTPAMSDEPSTPNSTKDEIETDYGEYKTKVIGDIFMDLRESLLPNERIPSGSSDERACQITESLLPTGQWPTKIQALVSDLKVCTDHTKSVVFSYRTSVLDMANAALSQAGISCVQVVGSLRPKERSRIFKRFSDAPEVRVLLLSLGCGAVGLNLTTASRAYLLEPQWNPAIEEQALARIHRLGQTREVTTIRFIISGSIEEYVLDIQEGKQDLISLLSNNHGDKVATKLQALRQLLR